MPLERGPAAYGRLYALKRNLSSNPFPQRYPLTARQTTKPFLVPAGRVCEPPNCALPCTTKRSYPQTDWIRAKAWIEPGSLKLRTKDAGKEGAFA